ncbi:hypothetical protein GQR58_020489 [Nymphon striatum]|nr:hypothetical protein GQR58_020489 [Nymphon striatum]
MLVNKLNDTMIRIRVGLLIREMNMAEKSIEIAHDRGLATEDLLKYDVLPSPMLFDDHGLMTKPEKSQLIRELEDKLVSDDYSYHHKPESAFIIDVMATVCRVPLIGRTHFSDLLLQLTHITDVYHRYGRCDYIFDIYNDNPSVYICEQSSQGHEQPTIISQLCINSNDWQCKKIHHSTEHYMQRLGSTVEEADLRIPMHVLDCCRAGASPEVLISLEHNYFIFQSQLHIKIYHRQVKALNLTSIVHSTMHTTMHVLDRQLNVRTEDLNPVDYGFRLEDGQLLPSTSWKTLEARWFVVCNCGKCARVTCPCREALVHCSVESFFLRCGARSIEYTYLSVISSIICFKGRCLVNHPEMHHDYYQNAVFYKVMLESCKGILIYEEILISVNLIFAKKMVKKRICEDLDLRTRDDILSGPAYLEELS